MDNTKYLSVPIKSLNNIIKFELQNNTTCFAFESQGCLIDRCYYDFRVSKLFKDNVLQEESENTIVHVNQIDILQPICLCIIFKSMLRCFILDENFFCLVKDKLSTQHRNNYHQLHIPYKTIVDNCVCVIKLQ
jgi:hypothetical protein